jgi:hypothetical protein
MTSLASCSSDRSDGPLPSETLAHFDRLGWAVAPGFFNATEVAQMSHWIDDLLARPEVPGAHWVYHQPSQLEPSRSLVQRIENFCPFHDGMDALARRSRLTRAMEQALGGPVHLFKEKINFKESGGAGFELHQDQQAGWSAYAPLFITVMISIDPASEANGCLEVAEVDQRLDRLIADEWRPITEAEATDFVLRPLPTGPGDVAFFDSYFPHASKANLSSTPRRVVFFTYNRTLHGDQRDAYHQAKRASFPPDIERMPGQEYRFRV